MRQATSHTLVLTVLLVAVATGGALAGRAEQTAPAPDIQAALLIEVRGLRAAMEQMASAGPRVQLALGRVQLAQDIAAEQARWADFNRRLEELERALGRR